MEITKVNAHCRAICQTFKKPDPVIDNNGFCTYCRSITALKLETYLDTGSDAEWREPEAGRQVDTVLVYHAIKFNLNHLLDEPLNNDDYDRIVGKLEDKAGSMVVYMKELNKHFRV